MDTNKASNRHPEIASWNRRTPRTADVVRLLASWFLTFLALLLTAELLPGFTYTSWWPLVAAAAVTGSGRHDRASRPGPSSAPLIGWIAVALATIFGQAIVMQLALAIVPGAQLRLDFWTAVAAAWIAAAFGTLLVWILSAGTDESFVASACCGSGRRRCRTPTWTASCSSSSTACPSRSCSGRSSPGPCRRCGAGSTAAPTRCTSGSCRCPARRRPASRRSCRARAAGVPAFRWYDRELGRVLVANRPEDAAIIESRASTGHGLLADDGVSISNLFTGDAPEGVDDDEPPGGDAAGSRRTRQVFARFLLRPDGLSRSLSRTIAEIVRERFQAVKQKRLVVYPRVHRSWTFAGLRAFSNGLLRDLNTAVVCEEMMRGARSIYVDYVDYDEIAHHAGATRIESLASLDRPRPGARRAGEGGAAGAAALPPRAAQRPRPGAGRAVRVAVRHSTSASCAGR